ncbi:TetR/AcrR family transcriptional regulator [Phenylobacterium sp.]|uniref:TetR/AcrR family transcriptional regulator n=1 Tax=Phenylobacterium sp. TaxID=1871053 RepID=UPI003567E96D
MTGKVRTASLEVGGVKTRVLAAAAGILATQGAEELSLRAIADSAGIGLASIYHYFASKTDLLLNLAIAGFEDLRRDILQLQADPAFASPMRGGHRAFFNFAETQPALFSLMFSERLMSGHETLREAEHQTFLAYQAAVQADPRIPSAYKEKAALALWALGRGMAAMITSQPDGKLPPETAATLYAGAAYLIDHPSGEP